MELSSSLAFLRGIPVLQQEWGGNQLSEYTLAAIMFLLVWLLLGLVRWLFLTRLKAWANRDGDPRIGTIKTKELADFVSNMLYSIKPFIFPLIAAFVAIQPLMMPKPIETVVEGGVLIILTWQFVRLASDLTGFFIFRSKIISPREDAAAQSSRKNIATLIRAALWVAGGLFVLDNFGINVSTFVAGLGIGGIAIALAAQAVLGDTFSSFAISLDKPFEIDDFIIVDGFMGNVEHVGLKTTRVRSLGGELLVFSNSDLTASRIRNYKKMTERRINFQVGVEYSTPYERLREIPGLIQEAIESTDKTRFDRAHFFQYGNFSLVFDIVYFVTTPAYNDYMDVQQEINFKIHEAFSSRGIVFAFPTQTIHLKQSE